MSTTRENPHPPLTGSARVLGTLALSVTTFMVILDTTIANVSLPAISGDLGASPSQGTWIITSFSVANAAVLPLSGWLAQRFGEVRLCVGAIVAFVLASCLCGLSLSLPMLVTCRILQGVAAAPMSPLAQSLLLQTYPRDRAATAMSAWATTVMVGPLAGPIAGGWITDNLSWSWIFFVNVPLGVAGAVAIWLLYHKRESKVVRAPIDVVGLVLLLTWVAALQILLDQGETQDWFESARIQLLAVIAALAFVSFVVWELTESHPVVDLSLFRNRSFAAGVIIYMLASGLHLGNATLLPLWLQTQMGYTAQWAGLVVACSAVVGLFTAKIVGRLAHHADARVLATVALGIFAAAAFLRTRFTPDVDFLTIAASMLLQGCATLLLFVPIGVAMYARLPPGQVSTGSGLANFGRALSGAISLSLSVSLWNHRATLHHAHLAEAISPAGPAYPQMLESLRSVGLQGQQADAALEQIISNQAYLLSTVEYYKLCTALYVGLILVVWLVRPGAKARAG